MKPLDITAQTTIIGNTNKQMNFDRTHLGQQILTDAASTAIKTWRSAHEAVAFGLAVSGCTMPQFYPYDIIENSNNMTYLYIYIYKCQQIWRTSFIPGRNKQRNKTGYLKFSTHHDSVVDEVHAAR
jgi:hypothetical protein